MWSTHFFIFYLFARKWHLKTNKCHEDTHVRNSNIILECFGTSNFNLSPPKKSTPLNQLQQNLALHPQVRWDDSFCVLILQISSSIMCSWLSRPWASCWRNDIYCAYDCCVESASEMAYNYIVLGGALNFSQSPTHSQSFTGLTS